MITLTTHWICKFFSSQSGNVGNIYTSKFYQNKRYLCLLLEKWVIFDISNKWGNIYFFLVGVFYIVSHGKASKCFCCSFDFSVPFYSRILCFLFFLCLFLPCNNAQRCGLHQKHTNKRNNNITLKFPFLMHHFTLLYPAHCYPTHVT